MTINGNLGTYKIIETDDGSQTMYSEFFDENCHSTSGAYSETIYNYIEGCEVIEKLKTKDELVLFEVGLGMALGPECLIDRLIEEKLTASKNILFYSTELDRGFALWVLENSKFAKKYRADFEDFCQTEEKISFKLYNVKFVLLIGDARKTVDQIPVQSAHCIFQDAFSPRKNPLLWTVEWFEKLKSISAVDCILSTYSSANSIRSSLILAGFVIESRKGFGRKRTCTRAFFQEYKKVQCLVINPSHALTDCNYREKLSI